MQNNGFVVISQKQHNLVKLFILYYLKIKQFIIVQNMFHYFEPLKNNVLILL